MLRLPSATPLTIFKNDSHKMFLVKKIAKKEKLDNATRSQTVGTSFYPLAFHSNTMVISI